MASQQPVENPANSVKIIMMPTYEYKCLACEARFEVVQSFADDTLSHCPKKGDTASPAVCESPGKGEVRKVFSAPAITFKGEGFYKTDSKNSTKQTNGAGAGKSTESKSSEGSEASDAGGDGAGASEGRASEGGASDGNKSDGNTSGSVLDSSAGSRSSGSRSAGSSSDASSSKAAITSSSN